MKFCAGAWLPDDDADEAMLHGGARYQEAKVRAVLAWTGRRELAVDIGAHCGLWSMQLLAAHFSDVVAFEPLERHIECFKKNVPGGRYVLHDVCLGERNGTCGINLVPSLSGRSSVSAQGSILMQKLDDFGLAPDLIKIDTEGYEYFVLQGAEETLITYRPAVIVEQKPGHAARFGIKDRAAIDYLEFLGAKQRDLIAGDWVFSWDKT